MTAFTWSKHKIGSYGRSAKEIFSKYSRFFSVLFFCLVGYLVYNAFRETDWDQVLRSLRDTPLSTFFYAGTTALLCYSAYALYDLISARIIRKALPQWHAWLTTWVCYSANMNLGAIVGSIALRYRLYSKLGSDKTSTSKIIAITVSANWIGYAALLSTVFLVTPQTVSEMLSLPAPLLMVAAAITLTLVILLILSPWIRLPGRFLPKILIEKYEMIGRQKIHRLFLVALAHWTLMAITMHFSFRGDIPFTAIYSALLISCIAGAVSHVPGGLGVIEAVFLTMLRDLAPAHEIIAALVSYRIVYYFAPLIISLPCYLYLEQRNSARQDKI